MSGGARLGAHKDPLTRRRWRRTVSFDYDLYVALRDLSKELGVSVQWLIQAVLRKHLKLQGVVDKRLDLDVTVRNSPQQRLGQTQTMDAAERAITVDYQVAVGEDPEPDDEHGLGEFVE